jgi:predicted membrane channel-forming protein YqfA (hemolysin III family)
MSKRYVCAVLGFLVMITPFLGIPRGLKTFVFVILGLGIVVFAQEGRKNILPKVDIKKEDGVSLS